MGCTFSKRYRKDSVTLLTTDSPPHVESPYTPPPPIRIPKEENPLGICIRLTQIIIRD